MPRSLPIIIVGGKNITAQFEAQAVVVDPQLSVPGGISPKKSIIFLPIEELDFYKLAFISAVILLSV